jgi:curli biogenesis system outer membrane secretion channel CsgG
VRLLARVALVAFLATFAPGAARADAKQPSVAVLNFTTEGLTGDWWGEFEPGVAISDLVTDQLVNAGTFSVVDRKNLDSVLQEHKLSESGEVSPASIVQSGRLIGARYIITGNVLQFDQTGQSGAAVGGLIGGFAGAAIGGIKRNRVTLKVAVRVIDVQSGQILESFAGEKTESGTSWGAGGFGGGVAGGYENSSFISSTMGHLINDEAADIASHIDPAKLTGAPAGPALAGRIIEIDGSDIILNIGSSKGVEVGQYFDVLKERHIKDPDSGQVLTSTSTVAKIQIVSVSDQTAVGRKISGEPVSGDRVSQEQF